MSAAETLAGEALKDYSPTDDEKVKAKKKVYDRAIQLGVIEAGARDLAIVATHGMAWTSKKFQRCLQLYTGRSTMAERRPIRHRRTVFTKEDGL